MGLMCDVAIVVCHMVLQIMARLSFTNNFCMTYMTYQTFFIDSTNYFVHL